MDMVRQRHEVIGRSMTFFGFTDRVYPTEVVELIGEGLTFGE
jgi:hypothetical protein